MYVMYVYEQLLLQEQAVHVQESSLPLYAGALRWLCSFRDAALLPLQQAHSQPDQALRLRRWRSKGDAKGIPTNLNCMYVCDLYMYSNVL